VFKKNKYSAKKTMVDNIIFDSKAEAEYYIMMKPTGMILELQPKVYMTRSKILLRADFLIQEGDEKVWIDVKGHPTPVANLKKRLWKHYGPGLLRWVKKKGCGFELLSETRGAG